MGGHSTSDSAEETKDYGNQLYCDLSPTPRWPLYHYTDIDSALSILQTNELWATDAMYLNDANELTNGEKVMQEVFNDLLAGAESDGEREALTKVIEEYPKRCPSAVQHHYFVSLSEKDDSLSQWRAYGGNGMGYSLGFSDLPLIPRHWPDTIGREIGVQIVKCIYDHGCFREIVLKDLNNVISRARKIARSSRVFRWTEFVPNAVLHVAHTRVPALKDSGFREEAEWRLVVTIDGETQPVDFRATKRGLTPFVKIRANEPESLIQLERFVVGPGQDKHLGFRSARLLVSQLGYDRSIVKLSSLPYRPH